MNSTKNLKKMLKSPSYRLAFQDIEFLGHEALRPVRLQLELQKPDMIMDTQNIQSTVVVFGSARLVNKKDAHKRVALLEKIIEKPFVEGYSEATCRGEGRAGKCPLL